MNKTSQRPKAVSVSIATVLALSSILSAGAARAAENKAAAAAAWEAIAQVLQHPRCLNCHQSDAPLQGDEPRAHVPRVVRGPDNHGVSAMRCGNCHNQMGNNETAGTPGAPHWSLAPASMVWQGLSVGELCESLKDPARNGNRSPEDLIHHMGNDALVLWGWEPGAGREPVPMAHEPFMELLHTWVAGGTPCPAH